MINTLNETHLHHTLKVLYANEEEGSVTEVQVGPYIADILCPSGKIIEIQTGNLSHLAKKIDFFLKDRYKVKVVYPLVCEKTIETYSPQTQKVTKRKSPRKNGLYDMFKELTGLYPYLLKRNFTLEILLVSMTEERRRTEEKVQSRNRQRRFMKDWLKTGKRLNSILATYTFKTKKDYLALLPKKTETPFTVSGVYEKLKEEKIKVTRNNVSLMLWVFNKMELIKEEAKIGKAKSYSLL